MKSLFAVSVALLVFFGPASAAENSGTPEPGGGVIAEKTVHDDLRLIGVLTWSDRFALFVGLEGGPTKQLNMLGALIGPYKLVAFDGAKGFADFEREPGPRRRLWLPDGTVKPGGAGVVALPALESIKGLVGLDEAIARKSRAQVEKQLAFEFNDLQRNMPWEARTKKLADLIAGNTKHIFVPPGGIDEAFAKKYGLTPQEVESANGGEEIGRQFLKSEKARKEAEKK